MPIVNLKVIGNGPYIEAPEFCPYKESDNTPDGYTIHASSGHIAYFNRTTPSFPDRISPVICSVCKYCTFLPEIIEDTEIVDVHKFIVYLTEVNSKLNYSITRQLGYLIKEGRQPLVILISAEICQQMLQYCFPQNVQQQQKLLSYYSINQIKLLELYNLPVYVSIKLTKSPVMVIGEIEWK